MTVPYVPFSEFEQSEQFPHASSRAVMEQIITHNVQSVVAGSGITVNSTDPENPIISATAYSLPQATPLVLGGMKLGTTFVFNVETGLTDVADYLSMTAADLAYAPIDVVTDFATLLFTGVGANMIGYAPVVGPVETIQECLHTHDQELSDHETVINNTVTALNNAVNALNALIADYGVGDNLVNPATFRLNLDVYSKSEGDARYLAEGVVNPTGIVDHIFSSVAPEGWVRRLGGTIGSSSSGASERADEDTLALFTMIWDNTDNAGDYVIQTSIGNPTTRGGTALGDFNANKRLPLPNDPDFDRGGSGAQIGIHYDDTLKAHLHTYQRLTGGGGASSDGVANDGTIDSLTTHNTSSTGDTETAPKHRCYLPIIKL